MKQLFIGLDVHKKSWAVILQEDKVVLKRFTMEADAGQLIDYVSKHYPQYQVECCYESCCCGYHIYHALSAAGWWVLVVNPGDIARGGKQKSRKTDRVDSAHLCWELAAGKLQGIYVPTHEQEQFRSLFRRRNELVKSIRRCCCITASPFPKSTTPSPGAVRCSSGSLGNNGRMLRPPRRCTASLRNWNS